MDIGFGLADYKIKSVRIYKGILLTFSAIIVAILLAELILDLRATTKEILIPFTILYAIVVLSCLLNPSSEPLRTLLISTIYVFTEFHFISFPTIFHIITYWLPFVPMIALVIQGLKSSLFWLAIVLLSQVFNYFYLGADIGDQYAVTVFRAPFLAMSFVFTSAMLATSYFLYHLLGNAYFDTKVQHDQLVKVKQSIEDKKNLLEKYHRELIAFSREEANIKDQQHLFREVCRRAAGGLGVTRVSLWILEEENQVMSRKYLFEKNHESDDIVFLERKQFPRYFDALEKKPFIIAADAQSNVDTSEFADSYLKPLNILSMLDCPIILDGTAVGVICCENQFERKSWNPEDSLFVQSLAEFIAISYKNERIKSLLMDVRRKNFELVEKNNEIEAMNEELNSLNEELTAINENLEATVRRRTNELECQNQQLTEYAFINSHLLRAPLSRILGLSNLIAKEVKTVEEKRLLDSLIYSTNELDAIIRRISDILYDGKSLTRQDIKHIIDKNLNKSEIRN
jgi:GAF domain-containing protein